MNAIQKILCLIVMLTAAQYLCGQQNVFKDLGRELRFIENLGQYPDPVKYSARSKDMSLWFEEEAVRFDYSRKADAAVDDSSDIVFQSGHVWDMEFLNANSDAYSDGINPFATNYNFFRGNDPEKWVSCAKAYRQIVYSEIWNGIAIRFRTGPEGELEFDFELDDNAKTEDIQLRFSGQHGLKINEDGKLIVHTELGPVSYRIPACYEVGLWGQRELYAEFILLDENTVGFRVEGRSEKATALVIDPILEYSTFIGCDNCDGYIHSIDISSADEVVYAGHDRNNNYPFTSGVYDSIMSGSDAVVGKMAADGKDLLFATCVGGTSGTDRALTMKLGAGEEIWVAGWTNSNVFPTTTNAFDRNATGSTQECFMFGLSNDGTALNYSTYFHGDGIDWVFGIDYRASDGHVFVGGWTESSDFPYTTGTIDSTRSGSSDSYILEFDPQGGGSSDLVFGTLHGGSSSDKARSLRITPSGVVLAGYTGSSNLTTTSGAYQTTHGGSGRDGYVTRFDFSTGTPFINYSTFFGGSDIDYLLALNNWGDYLFFGGYTESSDLPMKDNLYTKQSTRDAWIAKLSPDGNGTDDLIYSTYIGGSADEKLTAIAISGSGQMLLVGECESTDFPVSVDAVDLTHNGLNDLTLSLISNDGATLEYSTYFGGSNDDYTDLGGGVAIVSRALYLGGTTHSPDFPSYPNTGSDTAFQITKTHSDDTQVILKVGTLPLPVEFGEFTGESESDGVQLKWETWLEINADYFEIERSDNAFDFKPIAAVEARGSHEKLTRYSFKDRYARQGLNYYRISEFDKDGSVWKSKVISVIHLMNSSSVSIYPVPCKSELFVNWYESAPSEIHAVNSIGAITPIPFSYSGQQIVCNTSGIVPGIWILRLTGANGSSRSVLFQKD